MTGLVVLGIDPGNTGALAFLNTEGEIRDLEDMPVLGGFVNASLLADLIVGYGPIKVAVVEQVHSMPKQGVASSFKFGVAYGTVLGVVAGQQIPIVHAIPTIWKKHWNLNGKTKEFSRKKAIDVWPSWSDSFKLVKHDGRAEAALMARGWIDEHGSRFKSKRPVPALSD